jgi:outer membrane protein TolC
MIAALALAAPAAGQHVAVTLDDAVRRALDVQPAMVEARGEVRSASAGELAAFGAFLPSITAGGSATRSSGNAFNPATNEILSDPPSTAYSGGLTASLDLFDGFRRMAVRRAAGATHDAAEAGLLNQRFQVILATKQAFYDAVAREDLVRVAEAQERRAQQQLRISVQKLRAGSATRSDSLRATVDLGNARLALLQARANLATAQAELARQIGVDGPARPVADSTLPLAPDTAGLRAAALAAAPQVRQAAAQARAAAADLGAARGRYWPSLSASFSTAASARDVAPWETLNPYVNNWTLRFSLSWTLFDGFGREESRVAAAVRRDNTAAQAGEVRREVSARLTQRIAAMLTAHEQIDISRSNVAAAAEDLRVQQERYRVGAATILDLLTSQASLTQAEVNLVQARFNALLARAQVEALVGRAL